MLTSLYIQNLAVIEKVTIDFSKGMNLFTGETGAGKSIVIDAINAILGGRCSKGLVRTGEEKATIIGTFEDLPKAALSVLKKHDLSMSEDELIIQRDITKDGKTTARIGGMPVTVSALKELGEVLINIHGQHDNQILLSVQRHLDILDSYGELEGLREKYAYHFLALSKIETELNGIKAEQEKKSEKIEEIGDQIDEIERLDLEIGEDSELENDSRAIKNSARIIENLKLAHEKFNGAEHIEGISDQLNEASEGLDIAAQYYDDLNELSNKVKDMSYEAEEIGREISRHLDKTDFDMDQIDVIEGRLDDIYKIKRKYGATIEDVLSKSQELKDELQKIEMYDVRLSELIVCQRSEQKQVDHLAELLLEGRKNAAQKFVNEISKELNFLNMPGVVLEVRIIPCTPNIKGKEQIEFLISTNVGEPPKPLAKIASGGELSRIMLAVKSVLADKDEIPTLIFDEVDTGVSGAAAQKIGLKLKQVSKNRQTICVTHLAQIAALADNHFKIQKGTNKGRTFTEVIHLDENGRIEEVARIMSTGEITDLMLKTASEMISKGALNF